MMFWKFYKRMHQDLTSKAIREASKVKYWGVQDALTHIFIEVHSAIHPQGPNHFAEEMHQTDKMRKREGCSKGAACKLCGKSTKGYNYYGAVCCNACRSFFQRAILSSEKFVCERSEATNCNCRKCRFDKCLQAGMKPWLVMNQRKPRSIYKMSPQFTVDDDLNIRRIWSGMMGSCANFLISSYRPNAFDSFLAQTFDRSLKIDTFYSSTAFKDHLVDIYSSFYLSLPEFESQPKLLAYKKMREYMPLVLQLRWAQGVCSSDLRIPIFDEFVKYLSKDENNSKKLEKLRCCMQNSKPRTLQYEEAFPHVPLEKKNEHKALVKMFGESKYLDLVSSTLVIMVILLEDDKISKARYLRLIHLYTQSKTSTIDANKFVKDVASYTEKLRKMKNMSRF